MGRRRRRCLTQGGDAPPSARPAAKKIREAYETGEFSHRELADRVGVQHQTMANLLRGDSYKQAGGPTFDLAVHREIPKYTDDEVDRALSAVLGEDVGDVLGEGADIVAVDADEAFAYDPEADDV